MEPEFTPLSCGLGTTRCGGRGAAWPAARQPVKRHHRGCAGQPSRLDSPGDGWRCGSGQSDLSILPESAGDQRPSESGDGLGDGGTASRATDDRTESRHYPKQV